MSFVDAAAGLRSTGKIYVVDLAGCIYPLTLEEYGQLPLDRLVRRRAFMVLDQALAYAKERWDKREVIR